MTHKGAGAAIVALLLSAGLNGQAQMAAIPDTEHTVTVTTTGEAEADADWVEVNTTIEGRGITADEAVASAQNARERAVSDLIGQGFKAEDIRWTDLRITPASYGWAGPEGQGGPLQRFTATATLTVRINILDRQRLYEQVCNALDTAAPAGSTALAGPVVITEAYAAAGVLTFGVNDEKALRRQAMADAVRRARELGAAAAAEMGKTLGDVVTLSVQDLSASHYYVSYENMSARQPSRVRRYVTVTVTFKLQ